MIFTSYTDYSRKEMNISERKNNNTTLMIILSILMTMKHVESFTQPQNQHTFGQSKFQSYEWEKAMTKSKDYLKRHFMHLSINPKNTCSPQSSLFMNWNAPNYFSMDSLPSPFRSFGGWYNEVDATPASVVYNDMNMDTSFGYFSDSWSTVLDNELMESSMDEERKVRRPLKRIKSFANRAVTRLPRRLPRFKRQKL